MRSDLAGIKSLLKSYERHVIALLCIGVALMSIGVYLVGSHVPYGNVLLTIASAITYVSIIILVVEV